MPIRIKQTTNKKTIVIIAILLLLLVLATIGYLLFKNSNFGNIFKSGNAPISQSKESDRPVNDVDYSGPSETDIEESQNGKKNIEENDSTTNSSSVPVAVSFADVVDNNVEIRAFIPGVIEGTGKCTATLNQGAQTIQRSSDAFIDASSSQCDPIYIPVSELPSKGTWSLVVVYTSSLHTGKSDPLEVKL